MLGRIQVGEFSSIVGMIKRAQRTFGRLFTVSGVITAFRKSAVHQVDYWSPNMLTGRHRHYLEVAACRLGHSF